MTISVSVRYSSLNSSAVCTSHKKRSRTNKIDRASVKYPMLLFLSILQYPTITLAKLQIICYNKNENIVLWEIKNA